MKCEHIAELLPDYLQGRLSAEQHHNVEAHLEQCADCSEEVVIWRKLSLLPVDQPDPASRARFEAMLQAYKAGRSNQPEGGTEWRKRASVWSWNVFHWLRSPLGAAAWGAALLAIGVFAGLRLAGPKPPSLDLAAMQSELASMKQLVVLSMLQQQSASARLEGVTWSTRDQQLDPQVLSALLHTLRYDARDRKSTRLNSSHGYISYAVFCLKKKKQHKERHLDSISLLAIHTALVMECVVCTLLVLASAAMSALSYI